MSIRYMMQLLNFLSLWNLAGPVMMQCDSYATRAVHWDIWLATSSKA
jgi:hypothetical protein